MSCWIICVRIPWWGNFENLKIIVENPYFCLTEEDVHYVTLCFKIQVQNKQKYFIWETSNKWYQENDKLLN